jgi:hypothetical protein
MFIPDPTFFHPGSRTRTVSIPDPGSSSKNLSILTPKKANKWLLSSKKYDPGCSSRIRMLTFSHPGSRIQGSKRHPIPDPGSATLATTSVAGLDFYSSGIPDPGSNNSNKRSRKIVVLLFVARNITKSQN